MKKEKTTLKVKNYGEVLAQVNDLELVSFEEDGGYQGEYLAVLKDSYRLFYYIDSYGSCSGCDWLEDECKYNCDGEYHIVSYKSALDYCGELKPKYIVPLENPLTFVSKGEYEGFELKANPPPVR